ncbi:MAG: hypothetical protein JO247_18565 [Chloroflexi bacterium]|nr:hypothetical protein [Chloroflexota bacterium]
MAVQAATQIVQQAAADRRVVTLEWAGVALLLAVGAAASLAVALSWGRQLEPPLMGAAAWLGLVGGALLVNAFVQPGRARFMYLGLAVFAGLPLAAIPLHFYAPAREQWLPFAVAALGAALFGGAARWGEALRATSGTLRDNLAAMGAAIGAAWRAFLAWLHDAVIKSLAGILMLVIGGMLMYLSRAPQFGQGPTQQYLLWGGLVVVFLVGTVGLWVPGLYRRTAVSTGIRHVGTLAFWISLLGVPFLEVAPTGALPYTGRPSLRFIVAGLGLVIIGATWFLQRNSVLGHRSKPEPKGGFERLLALIVVVAGLGATLGAANMYQRSRVQVDQAAISVTNIAGTLVFEPIESTTALQIVQPLNYVPFYIEEVQFQDGKSYRLFSFLYPGDPLTADNHPLLLAIRSAAKLDAQSQPESRVEQWLHAGR